MMRFTTHPVVPFHALCFGTVDYLCMIIRKQHDGIELSEAERETIETIITTEVIDDE
jgi:hypothetical protein